MWPGPTFSPDHLATAVLALLQAEQAAPEELVDLGMVATVIEDIEDATKRKPITALRELKRRLYS